MKRSNIGAAALGAALTIVGLAAGGMIFVYTGAYDVAAIREHTWAGRWLLNTMRDRSVAVRVRTVPEAPPVDSAALAHGFEHYRSMCVGCHGAPEVEREEFGEGMTPRPPDLGEAAGEMSAQELFWITKHGIKMAGMPAFGPTHSDDEVWAMVAFVQRLAEMSPEEYALWESRRAADQASAGPDSAAAGHGEGHAPSPDSHSHAHGP